MADDNLSDEQLQQLLKDAENRLRSKGKKQNQLSEISALSSRYCAPPPRPSHPKAPKTMRLTIRYSIPQIASDKKIESYIKSTAHGPQIDASHLVSEQQRKLANTFRVVEDPITVKKKSEEVCRSPTYISTPSMRKIIPYFT